MYGEELHDFYSTLSVILVIKSRIIIREAGMGRGERVQLHIEFCEENLRQREHLEYLGACGKIILKWIFKKYEGSISWFDLGQNRNT